MTDSRPILTVTKHFSYPPERVFDAWLDPAIARKFLFTTADSEIIRADVDAQVGGKFTFIDRRDTEEVLHTGEYLEIDRPRRLVFTFGVPQYSREMTTVSIDILPTAEGCELTLRHEGVPAEWRDQTVHGWTMILSVLDHVFD